MQFCIAERALVPESLNNIDTSVQRVSGGARLFWWLSYRFAPLYDLPCGAAAPWVSHNDSIDATIIIQFPNGNPMQERTYRVELNIKYLT